MALQLEVGKYYKTRDGRKVKCIEDDGSVCDPCCVDHYDYQLWHSRCGISNLEDRFDDLIEEWTDEPTHTNQPPMTFYPLQRMIDCEDLPITRQEAKEMMRVIREVYANMEG